MYGSERGYEGWAKEISRIITVQMNILRGLLGMRRMGRIHKPRVSVAWSEEEVFSGHSGRMGSCRVDECVDSAPLVRPR